MTLLPHHCCIPPKQCPHKQSLCPLPCQRCPGRWGMLSLKMYLAALPNAVKTAQWGMFTSLPILPLPSTSSDPPHSPSLLLASAEWGSVDTGIVQQKKAWVGTCTTTSQVIQQASISTCFWMKCWDQPYLHVLEGNGKKQEQFNFS